jgi:hypothetical protein
MFENGREKNIMIILSNKALFFLGDTVMGPHASWDSSGCSTVTGLVTDVIEK